MSDRQTLYSSARIAAIASAADPVVIHTPPAGKRFVCLYLYFEASAVGAASTIKFQSRIPAGAATDLTGDLELPNAALHEHEHKNSGFPVFRGNAIGDIFQIDNPSTRQIDGWAVIAEVDV